MPTNNEVSDNVVKLPDVYKKTQTSNNAKMLAINELSIGTLRTVYEQLLSSLDIYQATGKTLDFYGEIVGQKRGSLNDTKYRFLILTKISVNTSGVDYNSIINSFVRIFDCGYNDIRFEETEDPATVQVTAVPFNILARSGFTSRQVKQILKSLLPIAVTLIFDELSGTFEFAATYNEQDDEKGFGNVEQTVGGTLSMLVGEDEIYNLPI